MNGSGWVLVLGSVLAACDTGDAAGLLGEDGDAGEEGEGEEEEDTLPTVSGDCSTHEAPNIEEGSTMAPGGDCVACHAGGEGPDYTVAGTVMNDYADGQGCAGISGVTVRITDADGALHELESNAVGNFYTKDEVPGPYTVEIERGGATTVMVTPQTETDCMACHTVEGLNGAPGRIIAP